MKRRTKIICTLGPAVDSRDKVKALIDAGMNVARLNCSHGTWERRRQWIQWVRELSSEVAPVAVLVDLQGPKFRIGTIPNGVMEVTTGQSITLGPCPDCTIVVDQPDVLAAFSVGARLLLGDGLVEIKITGDGADSFPAKVVTGGTVKTKQGVTVVGKVFQAPCLTSKDLEDLQQAVANEADIIALSYVHHAQDIRELRRAATRLGSSAALCAKIETRAAVQHLDEIIKATDIVMVARGDLGLQMETEEVPLAQKRIIEKCSIAGKPVITATQMLESMIASPRPTRAEASDVANAILDGTDAVMLSGETASGKYPVECVRTMVRIADKTEPIFDRARLERRVNESGLESSHTEAVAFAAVELAKLLKPAAIVTTTTSGQTTRLVSKFRPKCPILCATWSESTWRQMAVVWGVEAVRVNRPENTDSNIEHALDVLTREHRLKFGDQVILTAGVPAGVPGHTNLILTQQVK
jgi:pyruvate kinase